MSKITKKFCQNEVSKKIKINSKEYSDKQGKAISYSEVKKKYPRCKRFLKR